MNKIATIRTSSNYMNVDAYNTQELGLARELEKKGFSVDIFIANDVYVDELVYLSNNITLHKLKCIKLPGQNGYFPSLINDLKKRKYDLIQVAEESQITSVLVSIYAKKNKIPLVVWQGMYQNYSHILKRVFQCAFDVCLLPVLRKNNSMVLCKTVDAKKYIEAKGFYDTAVVGVGFDSSRLVTNARDIRKELLIPEGKKILLYVGKLEVRRNPDFLLKLISQKTLQDNAVLLVVGNGPLETEFRAAIRSLQLESIVYHVPYVPQKDISSYYAVADCFILPTNYEIYGMVVMEAFYFGLPVLATKTAGTTHLITSNSSGYLFDSLDVNYWEEELLNIITSEKRLLSMSEFAKKESEGSCWNEVAKHYISIFQRLINPNQQV